MKQPVPFNGGQAVFHVHTNPSQKRKKKLRAKNLPLTEWYWIAIATFKPERMNGMNIVQMFPDERGAA